MSKFNRRPVVAARTATGPIRTVPSFENGPHVVNPQGGLGYIRDSQGELMLLASTSIDITANAFYADGNQRVNTFRALIRHTAVRDPDWTHEFLKWLRGPGNIRTASIVGAVEAAMAMVHEGITGSRVIIRDVLQRADEPGEMIAYFHSRYGRKIPKAIKRGIADATARLYSERSLLKYDTASHAVRFADVIELTHPIAERVGQDVLLKFAIDRRHGHNEVPETLKMIEANQSVRFAASEGVYEPLKSPSMLHMAGMTWEDALSLAGPNVDKADLWRALIPTMGYMALLRNLRNFDEAGLSDEDVAPVITKLTDPEEVAKSRQLPLRFLSAYRAVSNLRWSYPLEQALDLSLANVPVLKGRTLIMVDTSGSMDCTFSGGGDLLRWDAAALFGIALARRCENADVVSFSTSTMVFHLRKGESLLAALARWRQGGFNLDHGTYTSTAVREHFKGHDRVVVLTDEQNAWDGAPDAAVPEDKMFYTFNLAGYRSAQVAATPTRITLGGLTDQMFRLIPQVEAGVQGSWPWISEE